MTAAALNESDALTYSPQGFRKVQGGWNAEGSHLCYMTCDVRAEWGADEVLSGPSVLRVRFSESGTNARKQAVLTSST